MFSPRVRNPEKSLQSCMQHFATNPVEIAAKLKRLGEQQGYGFTVDVVKALLETYPEHRKHLILLLEPEWHWRKDPSNEDVTLFGLVEEDAFKPAGFFPTYATANGRLVIYVNVPEDITPAAEDLPDPRKAARSGYVFKIHKRKGSRYFVVTVGRVDQLQERGFSAKRINKTQGKGYLKRYEAFVTVAGPFKDKEEAREVKNSYVFNKKGE